MENTTIIPSNNTINSSNTLLELSIWSVRLVCPLFVILSPVSNWACIRIFQSPIYARSSSKWYFIFIAIFDTVYAIVTAPLVFLLTLQIYILNWDVAFCKSILFLNYLSCQISAGLLACLSIDRLIATSYLFFYRRTCTTNFSKTVCFAVILMLSIVNSHYLIGYTLDSDGYCNTKRYKWYETNYSRLNIVYLLSYSIIPFTIITICNILIVISVCQNKTNMKKKYNHKKPSITTANQCIPKIKSKESKKSDKVLKFQECSIGNKHEMVNHLLDKNFNWQYQEKNPATDKLLSNSRESSHSIPSPPTILEHTRLSLPFERERSMSTTSISLSSSPTTIIQKMCIQLQITLSLLAISICFIFCTLPNCISTIMIQTYAHDDNVRKFWQAMNYFSIIPLLITHSLNLVFYYLSSHMFRERFKEYYFKKRI